MDKYFEPEFTLYQTKRTDVLTISSPFTPPSSTGGIGDSNNDSGIISL